MMRWIADRGRGFELMPESDSGRNAPAGSTGERQFEPAAAYAVRDIRDNAPHGRNIVNKKSLFNTYFRLLAREASALLCATVIQRGDTRISNSYRSLRQRAKGRWGSSLSRIPPFSPPF